MLKKEAPKSKSCGTDTKSVTSIMGTSKGEERNRSNVWDQ